MLRMRRGWWLVGLVAAVVGGLPSEARAQTSIRLGKVQGPSWSRVRAAIQVVMTRNDVKVVRSGEDGRISGQVRKVGADLVAKLSLIDTSGRVLGRAEFRGATGRDLAADVKARLWSTLGGEVGALGGAPPPAPAVRSPPPAPKPRRQRAVSPRTPPKAAAAPKKTRAAPRKTARAQRKLSSPPPSRKDDESLRAVADIVEGASSETLFSLPEEGLRFQLGVGLFARELSWVDDIFQSLAGYQLGAAPAFRVEASWFPGARFGKGPIGWLGLDVEAELPFAVSSEREGVSFPTAASAWRVGILGRIPTDVFEGQIGFGFAERRFHIERSEEGLAIADLPEVRYQTLLARAAILVRLADRFDLSLNGGWGFMLDAGSVGRGPWFPRSQSHTARVGGGVSLHITRGLSAFGRFDWEGAFFDLLPEPGDARVAGGMLDNYFLTTVGVAFTAR